MDYKTQHPECHPDETFIGNVDARGFAACGWKSKRRGVLAYDITGNSISAVNGLRPLFANTEEMQAELGKEGDV
jgi:hypothetical protein